MVCSVRAHQVVQVLSWGSLEGNEKLGGMATKAQGVESESDS